MTMVERRFVLALWLLMGIGRMWCDRVSDGSVRYSLSDADDKYDLNGNAGEPEELGLSSAVQTETSSAADGALALATTELTMTELNDSTTVSTRTVYPMVATATTARATTTASYFCRSTKTQNNLGSGTLRFPAYGDYAKYTNCSWDIQVEGSAKGIRFEIDYDISVDDSSCDTDALIVSTVKMPLHEFCGQSSRSDEKIFETAVFPFSRLRLLFHSSRFTGKGFFLRFNALQDTPPSMQLGSYRGGLLLYPALAMYTNNAYYVWSIRSRRFDVKEIELIVEKKDIESSPGCSIDALKIYSLFNQLLADVCGRGGKPETMMFPYGDLELVFTSDGSNTGRGFLLTYTFVTDRMLSTGAGVNGELSVGAVVAIGCSTTAALLVLLFGMVTVVRRWRARAARSQTPCSASFSSGSNGARGVVNSIAVTDAVTSSDSGGGGGGGGIDLAPAASILPEESDVVAADCPPSYDEVAKGTRQTRVRSI